MLRKLLVVGDPLVHGGEVLPYSGPGSTIMGHRVALIGGRARCTTCDRVGVIAKAGGDRRSFFHGVEIALDGDIVVCECPVYRPIRSTLQGLAWHDDASESTDDAVSIPVFGSIHHGEIAALKKTVESHFTHETVSSGSICPDISDRQLLDKIWELRDQAVTIALERIAEIDRWDNAAQQHIRRWFGVCNQDVRSYLRTGITNCIRVLRGLTTSNFMKYREGLDEQTRCIAPSNADQSTVASVCKSDLKTHTIFIAPRFCTLPSNKVNYDTREIIFGDSQLSTLVHEVTHFDDVFSSEDTWYYSSQSLFQIKDSTKSGTALKNADSLSSYILAIQGEARS